MNKKNIRQNIEELQKVYSALQYCKDEAKKNKIDDDIQNSNDDSELIEELHLHCEEEEKAVDNFFEDINEVEVREILTVLYAGMNHKKDFDDSNIHFEGRSRKGMKSNILSKKNLIEYLNNGMSYLFI